MSDSSVNVILYREYHFITPLRVLLTIFNYTLSLHGDTVTLATHT